MFDNKNLKIDFQQLNIYLNNKSFLNFNDEQKEIIDCFCNFLLNELNMEINEINNSTAIFDLNFYHNETKDNGEELEIDLIASSQSETKINIFLLEHKHYSKFNNNQSKIENDINKCTSKLKTIKNYFFSNDYEDKINIILIFGYKDQQNYYEYKLIKFNKNWEVKSDHKINQQDKENLSNLFKDKNNKWFNNQEFFNDKLKDAKDVKEIISCLKDDNYPFNVEPELNNQFSQKIKNESIKFFLIEGEAGTGKTLTAFSWFKKMKNNSIMWLINQKLTIQIKNKLKEKERNEFENKIFWHFNDVDDFFKEEHDRIKSEEHFFVFIDEAQRIRQEQIELINQIINTFSNIKIILFGDEKQKISKNDVGYTIFFDKKNDNEKWMYTIKKYYRINQKTLNIIKYVFCLSKNKVNKLINYKIVIPDTVQEFQKIFDNEFENDKNTVISSIEGTDRKNYDLKLREIKIEPAFKDMSGRENFLYIPEYLNKFYFFPYDLISREVNRSFIFLGKNVKMNEKDEIVFNNDSIPYINQLNVLLSRATKKLVVYIEDKHYRKKCQEKLKQIINTRGGRNE